MSARRLFQKQLRSASQHFANSLISCHPPGSAGELFAVKLLRKNLYYVWDTNWQHSAGELDIIAQYGDTLHFNEVKTRRQISAASPAYTDPEVAVDIRKTQKLRLLADLYCYRHEKNLARYRIRQFQFNILALRYKRSGLLYTFEVTLYPNAFPYTPGALVTTA